MNIDKCPRCEQNEVKTELNPSRNINTQKDPEIILPLNNVHDGDKRRDTCAYCGWWSEATFVKSKWVYKLCPTLSPKQHLKLKDRLKKLHDKENKNRYRREKKGV